MSSSLRHSLDLETTRPSATTGALELATLALDVRLLVLVGTEAEMLDGFTGVLGAAEEQSVGASWGTEGELIESEALTASLLNASASSGGEAESGNAQLGNFQHAVVISDSANNDDGLSLVGIRLVGGVRGVRKAGEGHWRAVDLRHKQAAENDLVEVAVGTTYAPG